MSERTKFLGWLHITLSDELPSHEIEQMWLAWEASAATARARLEAAEKDAERLNLELQKRDKCSYMGPMRDCPTHGESKDAAMLDWLEQHAWNSAAECFDFVNDWITPDGNRHLAGLREAISAATTKEPT